MTVLWVQGPRRFVDLRRPAGSAPGAQEGFAGELVAEGGVFEWRRRLDLSPPGPYADRGWLTIPDGGPPDALVEDGYEVGYVERWQRLPGTTGDSAALGLAGPQGTEGVLVRAGCFFALACGTPGVPSDGEISVGRIECGHWVTLWSSRPDREGELLSPCLTGDRLGLRGSGPDHGWRVTAVEGEPSAFFTRQTGK